MNGEVFNKQDDAVDAGDYQERQQHEGGDIEQDEPNEEEQHSNPPREEPLTEGENELSDSRSSSSNYSDSGKSDSHVCKAVCKLIHRKVKME
jgi:hypothetical protein